MKKTFSSYYPLWSSFVGAILDRDAKDSSQLTESLWLGRRCLSSGQAWELAVPPLFPVLLLWRHPHHTGLSLHICCVRAIRNSLQHFRVRKAGVHGCNLVYTWNIWVLEWHDNMKTTLTISNLFHMEIFSMTKHQMNWVESLSLFFSLRKTKFLG